MGFGIFSVRSTQQGIGCVLGYLQRGATQNTTDTAKKGGELLPMVRRVAPTSIVTLNVLKTTVKNNRLPNNQQQPKKQTAFDLQDCRRLPRAGFPLRKEFRKNRQRRARAARGRPLKRRVKRSDKTELDCIQFGPALQVPQYTHTHPARVPPKSGCILIPSWHKILSPPDAACQLPPYHITSHRYLLFEKAANVES